MHSSLGPSEFKQHANGIFDWFIRFRRAHYCDRQTDPTDREIPRYCVCNNKPRVWCDSYEWIFEEFGEQIWLWTREKLIKCREVGISAPVAGR